VFLVLKGGTVKRSVILFGVLILFAACATSSSGPRKITVMHVDDLADNPAAELDPDQTVLCENVLMAGSHIPQRICQTVRDRDQIRQQTQDHFNGKVRSFQVAQ
jgi:hypothetical protein